MVLPEKAAERARRIKLMVFDVDGVMTDASLYFTDAGTEIKAFNARDGLGMALLQRAGVELAVITGRDAACVSWRMKNLGIEHVYQGTGDKLATFRELTGKLGFSDDETGFMGDDLIDLKVMATCGFAAAPADGHALSRRYAHYVSEHPGGRGAVRDVCEFILAAQGKLDSVLAAYLPEQAV